MKKPKGRKKSMVAMEEFGKLHGTQVIQFLENFSIKKLVNVKDIKIQAKRCAK